MNSLSKSLKFRLSLLSAMPLFGFSSAAPTPSGSLKVKRKWEMGNFDYERVAQSVWGAENIPMLVEVLTENQGLITEAMLSFAWQKIDGEEYDTSVPEFEQALVPLTMEYIRSFGRAEGLALGSIASFAGSAGVKNPAFWDLVEKKLIEERLIRYVPNPELCMMVSRMGQANVGSNALYEACEAIILKHLKGLDLQLLLEAREGFRARKLGSQELMNELSRVESMSP